MLSANATVRLPNTTIDLEVESGNRELYDAEDDTATAGGGAPPAGARRLPRSDASLVLERRGVVEAEMFGNGFTRGGGLDEAFTETRAGPGAMPTRSSASSQVTLSVHEARVLGYRRVPHRARRRARRPVLGARPCPRHARAAPVTGSVTLHAPPLPRRDRGRGAAGRAAPGVAAARGAVLPTDEAAKPTAQALPGQGPGQSRAAVDVDRARVSRRMRRNTPQACYSSRKVQYEFVYPTGLGSEAAKQRLKMTCRRVNKSKVLECKHCGRAHPQHADTQTHSHNRVVQTRHLPSAAWQTGSPGGATGRGVEWRRTEQPLPSSSLRQAPLQVIHH